MRLTRLVQWRHLVCGAAMGGGFATASLSTSQPNWRSLLAGLSSPLCSTTSALCEGKREVSVDTTAAANVGILNRILQDERLEKWAAVSRSMQACLQHVGPWSLGDLAFGLRAVAEQHAEEHVEDAITGRPITDRRFVEQLLEDNWVAEAVHQDDVDAMANMCALRKENIVKFEGEADHFRTAFAIAVWPERKEVVLVIRGTISLADALTDLSGNLEPFDGTNRRDLNSNATGDDHSDGDGNGSAARTGSAPGAQGHAHHGILRAAQWLLESQGDTLAKLLADNPGYKLKVVGHSLGAGTAALVSILAHNDPEVRKKLGNPEVRCVAFATPPVVTKELAVGGEYITTVVYQYDVVPRASLANFEQLRQEMLATKWEDKLSDDLKISQAFDLAVKARASLDETLNDIGVTQRSEEATRAIASAWAGAKGSIMAKLGSDASEAAEVGAAVGTGVERARNAEEAADPAAEAEGRSSPPKSKTEDGRVSERRHAADIPQLYAPGKLLYLRHKSGKEGDAYQLLEADPPEQRFKRIVLNEDMINHHRCTAYIDALKHLLDSLKSR